MIRRRSWASRTSIRLALALALVAGASRYAVTKLGSETPRPPAVVATPNASPPKITRVAGVTYVVSRDAPERIVPDTAPPDAETSAQLVWLAGRAAAPTLYGAVVVDPGGSIVVFDAHLRPHRPTVSLDGREVMDVAPSANGGWWIVDGSGRLLLTDRRGSVVRDLATPFSFPTVTSAADGAGAWVLRSPARFGYSWDTIAPLLARVDELGAVAASIGRARVPEHVMLQDLMNAGRAVADRDRIYYVPFIRDEIVALDTTGDTLWLASRDLPQTRGEPRFELQDGRVVIDYHPVNLGASLGPDDRLYVLSTPGFTTERSRLDAFDPQTGRLLRSAELDTALPTIAVDTSGRVYLLDATRLLTGIAPAARERFPRVALATSAGDSVHSASFLGSVTLVNLWASWCKPCREEMPALDEIRRAVRDTTFAFVSINGDAARASAEEFLREMALDMPFAIAGPDVARDYRAPGLPYTVLLDRDGRIVQRWVGYTGPDQIAVIRAAIQLELERGRGGAHAHH